MSCFPWKASIAFGLIFWLTALAMARQGYSLLSPDKRIEIKIHAADRLKYDLFFKGKALLQDSQLSINIDHVELGLNPKVASARKLVQIGSLNLRSARNLRRFAITTTNCDWKWQAA